MSATEAFFDTNVVAYFASTDVAKAKRSGELLRAGGVVSVQVLNEFAALARRKQALPWSGIRTVLAAVRSTCTVATFTVTTHELGLALAERYELNLYDGMIIAAAQLAGCKTLYSEDMHDGLVIDRLTIRNPFAACHSLQPRTGSSPRTSTQRPIQVRTFGRGVRSKPPSWASRV